MSTCCGINNLSDEVLLEIFSYFSQKELCRYVAPICVAWLNLSRDWSFWEEITEKEYRDVPDDRFIATITSWWCSHLKSVDFKARSGLTKADFEAVFKNCPELERISFELCSQIDDNILQLFSKHCSGLKFVNLTGSDVSTKSMYHFAGKPMQEFNLSSCCDNFTDEGLIYLAKNFKDLSMINLGDAVNITPRSIRSLTRLHSDHLVEVALDGEWLRDKSIRTLSRCTMIRNFMIAYCHRLTDKSLKSIKEFKHLEKLKLKIGPKFSETGIIELAKSFKDLVGAGLWSLNLVDCSSLSDECLHAISERSFMIAHCHRLTDKSLKSIKEFKHLEKLKLKIGPKFSETGIIELAKSFKDLVGAGLWYLKLGYCSSLSDECLHAISESCRNLQVLIISHWSGVTDHGINFIFDSCHKIRELRLKGLNEIEGVPLRRAPVEMPKLAVLDLAYCARKWISDDILVELKNEMKTLRIVDCKGHVM